MSMPLSPLHRPETPGDLLTALADTVPVAAQIDALLSQAHIEGLAAALTLELAQGADPLPAEVDAQRAWLLGLEERALALEALEARTDRTSAWASALAGALAGGLWQGRAQITAHPSLLAHGRLAEERIAERPGTEPWQSIAQLSLPEVLDAHTCERLVEAWLSGGLSGEASGTLRTRVREHEGSERAAYAAAVRQRLARLGYAPNSVAAAGAPFWAVSLPHLGDSAAALARIEGVALVLCWPGAEEQRLAHEVTVHTWPVDPVLGACETRVAALRLDALGVAESATQAARLACMDPQHPASSPRAIGAASALLSPPWLEALTLAAQAVTKEASDDDERLLPWVMYAVSTRELLDAVAGDTLEPALLDALDALDAEMQERRACVHLLDLDQYELATGGGLVDPACWWSREAPCEVSARVERALDLLRTERRRAAPQFSVRAPIDAALALRVTEMLSSLGRISPALTQPPQRAPLGGSARRGETVALASSSDAALTIRQLAQSASAAFDKFKEVLAVLERTPCAWLRSDVREALAMAQQNPLVARLVPAIEEAVQPQVGCVAVTAAIEGHELASVWELRIARGTASADPWEKAPALREIARDAIRTAYFAVASLLGGHAPLAFDDHAFVFVGGDDLGIQVVDGASIGLSAAIAFASLWANQQPDPSVCATARLLVRQDKAPALLPVGHVTAKADALARLGAAQTLLVAEGNVTDGKQLAITPSPQATLRAAIKAAGLDLSRISADSWAGADEESRAGLLHKMSGHVDSQRLDDYRGRGSEDPWMVLADRMRQLIDDLANSTELDTRRIVAEARPRAALAFSHLMDGESAEAVLAGLDIATLTPALAFHVHIVRLGRALDASDWDRCDQEAAALNELHPRLDESDRKRLAGLALGARGRAQMHRRQLSVAIPLLTAAVEHHSRYVERELGRSRIYLAMALRMDRDLAAALEQLAAAAADIERSRKLTAAYAAQTSLFLLYETARSLLDAGHSDKAEQVARQAEQMALLTGNWWPLLGIRRTLAWALRDRGDDAAADRLAELIAQSGAPIADVLADEARGAFIESGFVY